MIVSFYFSDDFYGLKCSDMYFVIIILQLIFFPILFCIYLHFLFLTTFETRRYLFYIAFFTYMRFHKYAIENWHFFWNLSSNLQVIFVGIFICEFIISELIFLGKSAVSFSLVETLIRQILLKEKIMIKPQIPLINHK